MAPISTVAVVGSGVIGSSWAYLFLSHGLYVVMSDPAKGAEEAFRTFVSDVNAGLKRSAEESKQLWERFEFVDDITARLPMVDFVQEVRIHRHSGSTSPERFLNTL